MPNRTAISRIGRRSASVTPGKIGIERLAVHFGKALGGAEHRDWLDRLVGRDHDHRRSASGCRRVGNIDRTKYVGLDALLPILLEQRHMLERGGMKNDIGLEIRHQAKKPLAVADIGDAAVDCGR